MKTFIIFLILLISLILSITVQNMIPPFPPDNERLLIFPIIFCFSALYLPFPMALLFGICTAFLYELNVLYISDNKTDIDTIYPMIFFLGWNFAFYKMGYNSKNFRWEIHAFASTIVTLTLVAGEFWILCFQRNNYLDETVFLKIAISSVLSFIGAPIFYLILLIFKIYQSEKDLQEEEIE